jgi:hypothetical protein
MRVEPLGLLQDDTQSFIPITPEACLLVPHWLVLASLPSQVLGLLSLARWAALISWRLLGLLATLTASGKDRVVTMPFPSVIACPQAVASVNASTTAYRCYQVAQESGRPIHCILICGTIFRPRRMKRSSRTAPGHTADSSVTQ